MRNSANKPKSASPFPYPHTPYSSSLPTTLRTFVLTSSHSFARLLSQVIAPPAPMVHALPSTIIVRMTTERSVAPSTEI